MQHKFTVLKDRQTYRALPAIGTWLAFLQFGLSQRSDPQLVTDDQVND